MAQALLSQRTRHQTRRRSQRVAFLFAAALAGPARAGDPRVAADAAAAESESATALGRREARRLADERYLVELGVGVDLVGRRFSYSDGLSPNLPGYSLFGAPEGSVDLGMYPAAATGVPFLCDLGLRGWASRAFALDSTTDGGTKIVTDWTRFGGELHERIAIPPVPRLRLGAGAGIDASYFDMSTTASLAAVSAGARVVSLRFALDARFFVGARSSVFASGAFLAPLSSTGVYERFRSPRVGGTDVECGIAVAIVPGVEARLQARYARYYSAFRPVRGDAYVAGGALDDQLQLGMRLVYAH